MAQSTVPNLSEFANAEHCVLEDPTAELEGLTPVLAGASQVAREITGEVAIRDRLRGRKTTVIFYAEGWVDVETRRRGGRSSHHRIDLRYLDPEHVSERHYASGLLWAGAVAAVAAVVAAMTRDLASVSAYATPAMLGAATASVGLFLTGLWLSYQKICFKTVHGRADAISFDAGLGTIHRFRRLVPRLHAAIAAAAEAVFDETAVYLRAEMREHYRLRGDEIISDDECAVSTERILGKFEKPA